MLSLFKNLRKIKTPVVYTDQRVQVKKRLENELAAGRHVVLLYLDIMRLSDIELKFGYMAAGRILQHMDQALLVACRHSLTPPTRLIAIQKLWADDYAVYLSFEQHYTDALVHQICITLKHEVEKVLNRKITHSHISNIEVHIGYAKIEGLDLAKDMYSSVKLASQMAKCGFMSEEFRQMQEFRRIMEQEDIHTVIQPIVSLKTGIPLGWETLVRGPENSHFHSPGRLFSFAQKTGASFQLESLCRRYAIKRLEQLRPSEKLFINLDARSIDDPFLLRGRVFKLMEQYQLNPHNIVFEITERHAIKNFASFRAIIQAYRKKGYLIAVDDAGAGYSSLEAIAEIYPDYIKLDMALIRNIDSDAVKQALVETFVQFADKVKCRIIGEGIETESELETLVKLGVDYGQGFLLGRPSRDSAPITEQAINKLRQLQEERSMNLFEEPSGKIGDIIRSTVCVSQDTLVREVHHIFERNAKIDSIVVLEDRAPRGLIMRFQLYKILGGQYGIALYYEKPVSQLMNHSPLIVDRRENIELVAKTAMERQSFHLYDVIIITEKDKYVGVVTVQSLLDMLAKAKLEIAAVSNPLTGLPGNVRIDREIAARVKKEAKKITGISYAEDMKLCHQAYT
ncbi:EAL domain-containing protein [Aneurinibacillus migulanus]|uniref:EAL domain, c-di-GMP-specific phosphodiesterase class I (Or its enzymatically inactive variant) n=1 Tax=Aneurinibacillus migulanus TaxID=47500 RepID=A0A1G8LNN1_ANEMI|nr:EAL domain-containing protein [Aneurinibacillus migulanus]MED0893264.1 EAL domain-containing protein [Aneurinibacillus migulanus]MED1615431.1 EAL domain-containing protein [Aneurinibacillus migulanus]GED14605.1 GGDEF domain-containing protein [Aneurinibacillus migulanus]SDI56810.1 EAL domain, c-di-GMP-specific phosphodiesterase class I (or its enzymatically inactive variant) [Aneurinibacillus migulanus]